MGTARLASLGGKAILSPSRGKPNTTPSGGGYFIDKDYVRSELLPLAKKIAASHDFLRVDLFVGKDGVPYLNEITFSPVNAKMKLPPDFDLYLGNYWKL